MAVEDLLNYFEDAGIELGMEDLIIIIQYSNRATTTTKGPTKDFMIFKSWNDDLVFLGNYSWRYAFFCFTLIIYTIFVSTFFCVKYFCRFQKFL